MALIGRMRERLTLQSAAPVARSVLSLTRSGTTATATTAVAHGFATGDYVDVTGATPAGYAGRKRVTVTGAKTFTFAVDGSLTTPATGAIAATYVSDAQGGRAATWHTVARVWAELIPIRAAERLDASAIASIVVTRFRIRARADVAPTMRAVWRPRWPRGCAERILEIGGVLPDGDGRTYLLLECEERQ